MESQMLNLVKAKNSYKDYPSNMGQKWTYDEEALLSEELNKNMSIELIAETHSRTIGGINSRRRFIAYKMYINNYSIQEIVMKTKLNETQIIDTIKTRQNNSEKCKSTFSIENEIVEIKNNINDLKNAITELVEMMKAVYEFENM
jgi:hypothetical protein